MKVQVITLKSSSMEPRLVERMRSAVELAVSDTPGIVSTVWIMSAPEVVTGVSVWENARALESFRHSELYARMMLCPHLDDARDCDVPEGRVTLVDHQPDGEIDLAEWIPEAVYAEWKESRQYAYAA